MTGEAHNHDAYLFARKLVELHDQEGMPIDLSLSMASERGKPVALLGLLAEAAERRWPKSKVIEVARQWAKLNIPTAGESRALDVLLGSS